MHYMNLYKLRLLIPGPIKALARGLSYLIIFSDLGSLVRFYRVSQLSESRGPGPKEIVNLRIRQLQNQWVAIRTRGTDARVLYSTFIHKFHLPPRNVVSKN